MESETKRCKNKRVMLYMPEGMAHDAKVLAAELGVTLSQLVRVMLENSIKDHKAWENTPVDVYRQEEKQELEEARRRWADEYHRGADAGRRWAKKGANGYQLERASMMSKDGYPWSPSNTVPHLAVYCSLIEGALCDAEMSSDAGEFWMHWMGIHIPEVSHLHGFVDGAASVYAEVADELT
jgi:antitoxin component of RelBE/YafQ-DinJ toxin-antitoxin module